MTLDEAKALKMKWGKYKDTPLGSMDISYLKWMGKNWVHKQFREAAIMVVNARSLDIGQQATFRPSMPKTPQKPYKVPPVAKFGAFGELLDELNAMPDGLF